MSSIEGGGAFSKTHWLKVTPAFICNISSRQLHLHIMKGLKAKDVFKTFDSFLKLLRIFKVKSLILL